MASKYLLIPLLLLGVALNFSASRAEPRSQPVIHIINALKSPISIKIFNKAGDLKLTAELSPGQDYQIITVDVNDVVFAAIARYGLKIAPFFPYERARDFDQAAIYWKADDYGFSFSHNNNFYVKESPWRSE